MQHHGQRVATTILYVYSVVFPPAALRSYVLVGLKIIKLMFKIWVIYELHRAAAATTSPINEEDTDDEKEQQKRREVTTVYI